MANVLRSGEEMPSPDAGWSFTDAMVFLFAAVVLLLSIAGVVLLIRN